MVWAGRQTLDQLENREWLQKQWHPWLDKNILWRTLWQRVFLNREAKKNCHILFLPAANTTNFRPYISMCQNLLPFDKKERQRYGWSLMRLRLKLLSIRQKRSFSRSNGVIFLSRYSKKVVDQQVPVKLSTVVYHGVSSRFKASPVNLASKKQVLKLLYVSIIDVYKHQWNVVEAVFKCLQSELPVELTLLGPKYPPAMKKVNQVMEQYPQYKNYVTVKDFVPYEKLVSEYQNADAFIFASSCETFGMIPLEAMSTGLPVLSSNRSAMPEILGDSVIYFDPLSVKEIEKAIKEIHANPETLADYSRKSLEYYKKFTWEKCARETFSFISKATEN